MLVCSTFDWRTSVGDDEIMSGLSAISPVGSLKHLQRLHPFLLEWPLFQISTFQHKEANEELLDTSN